MHILITGGAGFIGSHLAEALLERGHEVTVIDNLSTGRLDNVQHLVERQSVVNGRSSFRFAIDSITNEVVLDRLASECDVIFHLAAAVGVKLILESPVHTIETNVMGTEAVLKAALRYRAKVIIASTSEVYGMQSHAPLKETDYCVYGPSTKSRWSYAASKLIDEFTALAYYRTKKLPVVIVRLFNTVGPRQTWRYGMVIPRFVKQALEHQPLTVYGDGTQTRTFTHVKDVTEAMVKLMDIPEAIGEVVNIGGTQEVSILNLAELIKDKTGSSSEIKLLPYSEVYPQDFEDMQRRVPSTDKLKHCPAYG